MKECYRLIVENIDVNEWKLNLKDGQERVKHTSIHTGTQSDIETLVLRLMQTYDLDEIIWDGKKYAQLHEIRTLNPLVTS